MQPMRRGPSAPPPGPGTRTMQTFPHTPAHAQHVPDGWGFPALSPAVPPPATTPAVMGGGAPDTSATRVRWGRILLLVAGVALVAFGAWRATSSGTEGTVRTASGGGTSEVEVAPAAGADEATVDLGTSGAGSAATTDGSADAARATAAPVTPRTTARPRPAARAGAGTGRRPARRAGAGAAAGTAFATAPAMAAPPTVAGGGAPSGQLPVTGLETWIAAGLGILVLGLGIALQVHAVRIGMTAMLYRRGILLRPVDCARLAQEHGLSQLRVLLSNALHRLLQEPAGGSDFVRVRAAR